MRELSLNNCRLDKRYDVEKRLGRGSYAEIFVARDSLASPQSPHNLVVIKALNVFLQDDPDPDLERTLVENFQNEAIALDRVRHPNIISRLGHGTARDLKGRVFHYLVLEYLSGGDLQKACRTNSLSLRQVMNYVEQVCAGLRHAHNCGIIHRDIKPHNLLLTGDAETVKIADFGVARVAHSDSPITRVGTNIYAPPEHSPMLAGRTGVLAFAELTFAADMYSLAKSIYTLVTCEAPRFYSNQPIDDLPPSVREEEWADEMIRVLKKATQTDPRERHQSVDEFWADLSGIRKYLQDGEIPTQVRSRISAAPQAHVSRGYSPLAPQEPRFDTSKNLKLPNSTPAANAEPAIAAPDGLHRQTVGYQPPGALVTNVPNVVPSQPPVEIPDRRAYIDPNVAAPRKKRRGRGLIAFVAVLLLFAGGLYGTHVYLRGLGIDTGINIPFSQQTATANTDIYLRPTPNIDNDPIGLVTKNSKVRILDSQNNWYQVDILEQGRVRSGAPSASRGWLNGKYLDINN